MKLIELATVAIAIATAVTVTGMMISTVATVSSAVALMAVWRVILARMIPVIMYRRTHHPRRRRAVIPHIDGIAPSEAESDESRENELKQFHSLIRLVSC